MDNSEKLPPTLASLLMLMDIDPEIFTEETRKLLLDNMGMARLADLVHYDAMTLASFIGDSVPHIMHRLEVAAKIITALEAARTAFSTKTVAVFSESSHSGGELTAKQCEAQLRSIAAPIEASNGDVEKTGGVVSELVADLGDVELRGTIVLDRIQLNNGDLHGVAFLAPGCRVVLDLGDNELDAQTYSWEKLYAIARDQGLL